MDALSPVLIANRGEIAVRIARTVHALGLRSVGVVAQAELARAAGPSAAGPAHADAVDVAVPIASYLDVDELLRAARLSGARSVHPGYGFLSENATFARAVIDAGLVWIGPPPAAIELMGDKGRAKEAATAAGVPVVPAGTEGGFPVVVKAVAGGGGKGMRVARSAAELEGATAAAQREARAAFGDDRVLIERYLERPRHIEVQVLADRHGACVHLGERECSLQRRHQKVVEEAPSPVVGEELRARMGDAAVALARACGYEGAGTVEFIATGEADAFFFLEMNTRLQVEHPVTELVYGVDLVEQQLRVAAGEPLGLDQAALAPRGHAVEARLYAEDPAAGFLPATGTVHVYREPSGEGVRVDSGIRLGTVIGTAYDPMLAKVIAHAPDRPTALRRLDRALADLDLLGITTNAAFTRALLAREDIRAGEMDTGLLERVLAGETGETRAPAPPAPSAAGDPPRAPAPATSLAPPPDLLPAAALAAAGTATPPGPWRRRLAGHGEVVVRDGAVHPGERAWEGATVRFDQDGAARVTLDGVERRYAVHVTDDAIWIARDGHHLELLTQRAAGTADLGTDDALQAPMPGTVLLVHATDGDVVAEGDVLLVLESMKMELAVTAPHAGTVADLALAPGDLVSRGQVLLAVHGEDAQ